MTILKAKQSKVKLGVGRSLYALSEPISVGGIHNVVDRGVLQAMWEELAGKCGHRDQFILSVNHVQGPICRWVGGSTLPMIF